MNHFDALDAVLASAIPKHWKLPLLAWLRFADEKGEAWPTARAVADRCGQPVKTTATALQQMATAGILETVKVSASGVRTRRLCVDAVRAYAASTPPRPRGPSPSTGTLPAGGDTPPRPRVDPSPSTGPPPPRPRGPELPIELNQELPKNDPREKLRLVPTPAPEVKPADQWGELAEFYAGLPGCKAIRKRDGGLGRNLARVLDVHGPDDARLMLEWMAYASDCPKATSLGESGHRTLGTIGREQHVEAYWAHVDAWVRRGKKGHPDAERARRRGRGFVDPATYDPLARNDQ